MRRDDGCTAATPRVGAAAHNVDGDLGEPLPPATTSRGATPPSTMWTAACAISVAQIATRVSDDRNKTGEAITEAAEQEGYGLLALLAMGKCNCRWWGNVLDVGQNRFFPIPMIPRYAGCSICCEITDR